MSWSAYAYGLIVWTRKLTQDYVLGYSQPSLRDSIRTGG